MIAQIAVCANSILHYNFLTNWPRKWKGSLTNTQSNARTQSAPTRPGQLGASIETSKVSAPQDSKSCFWKSCQVLRCNFMYKIIFKINKMKPQYQTKFASYLPYHLMQRHLGEMTEHLCVFDYVNTGYRHPRSRDVVNTKESQKEGKALENTFT